MSLLDNLPHTCVSKRRVRTTGSMMGSKDSFDTAVTHECWRQPASDKEISAFEKDGISVTNKFYFTTDPALSEEHIIISDSETFEVRSFANPDASAGLGYLFRVMVERTTTGDTFDDAD